MKRFTVCILIILIIVLIMSCITNKQQEKHKYSELNYLKKGLTRGQVKALFGKYFSKTFLPYAMGVRIIYNYTYIPYDYKTKRIWYIINVIYDKHHKGIALTGSKVLWFKIMPVISQKRSNV